MKSLKCLLWLLLPFAAAAQQYKPTWESLDSRPVPAWFENAKFGIFIHWGVYSVPAWAPKGVYAEWYQYWLQSKRVGGNNNPKPTAVYDHHAKVYGADFSYYQFADMFKAEDFDPDAWAKLLKSPARNTSCSLPNTTTGLRSGPAKKPAKRSVPPWNAMESQALKRDLLKRPHGRHAQKRQCEDGLLLFAL